MKRLVIGPAGSGKTHYLLDQLKKFNKKDSILILAPTHKALGVIRNRLSKDLQASIYLQTIHSALGYKPEMEGDKDFKNKKNIKNINILNKNYKEVFVDEGSMINREMLLDLLKIKNLTILGDPYQLPAVGEKTPAIIEFKDMFEDVVKLKEVHRIKDDWKKNISLYPQYLPKIIKEGLKNGKFSFIEKKDLNIDENSVILAYTNKKVWEYNMLIRQKKGYKEKPVVGEKLILMSRHRLFPVNEEITIREIEYKKEKVMTTSGMKTLEYALINNLIKWVYKEEDWQNRNKMVQFWKGLKIKEGLRYEEDFPKLDYAYALTVHRSQGSQWKNVYLDLKDIMKAEKPILNRLLYTAATRFQKDLNIII